MGASFDIYNLAATLAVRRFVATYRKHMFMLGIFIVMVVFSLVFLIRVAMMATTEEGAADLQQTLTAGALATVAFVLLFVRGLVDVQRTVLKDRALWSTLTAPIGEGRVRAGLLMRTMVFQMGLLAVVMGTFALVLLMTPDKPNLPRQAGPLIMLAGLAAAALPLPLLLSSMGIKETRHKVILGILVTLEVVFTSALILDAPMEWMLSLGVVLLVVCIVVTYLGPPVLAPAWSSVEGQRYRPSGKRRGLPPAFSVLLPKDDPISRALFRREMSLSFPPRQRVSMAGLNVAIVVGLVIVNVQLGQIMMESGLEDYYRTLLTPLMVGLGIYAICYFQATMPLVDGVTREGPAFWVMRAVPVTSKRYIGAKVRPLLAFMPLSVVATGFALPFVVGMGWEAMAVGVLGAMAIYLAFLGVGAWAGATYPNLDQHSNAPPDIVLAFYLMFACLFLEGFLLIPVVVIAFIQPFAGVLAALVAVLVGWGIMRLGISAGGRSLSRLEIG